MKITFHLKERAQKDDLICVDDIWYIVDSCKKTKTGFKVEVSTFSYLDLHRVANIDDLQKYLAKHELPTA